MSQKGLYKKTIGSGWDHDPDSQRPRENRFFDKAESGEVNKKSKSKGKGKPRADHKHVYEPVLVWSKSAFSQKIKGDVREYCLACGRQNAKSSYAWLYKTERKYLGKLKHFFQDESGTLTPIDENTYRKTVFLGGSTAVDALSWSVKNELINILHCGHKIIVGDGMGADLQFQKLISENGYKNVVVYYSGGRPRLNLGEWKTKYIPVNKYATGDELQRQKNEQMAQESDEGYILMRGDLPTALGMVRGFVVQQKSCRVAFYDDKKYAKISCSGSWRVETEQDIEWLLRRIEFMRGKSK